MLREEPMESVVAPDPEISTPSPPLFSVFTRGRKRWIVLLTALAGMFSPMSSFIFYPAITSIANSLSTTVELVNLTITSYMIISGVVPSVLGSAADRMGRRPIYLLALSIYLAANLGLALQNSFAALLVFRMLQSAGSSGTISFGYGVISDISTPAERGLYVGIMLLGFCLLSSSLIGHPIWNSIVNLASRPNVAPPVGPILGGVLAAELGWKWIFWFLCIASGLCLLLILFTLPETCRALVGNGGIPATGINRMITIPLGGGRTSLEGNEPSLVKPRASWPNPMACLRLLLLKDVAIVLVCNGQYYMIYCCVQASLLTLFIDIYHYDVLQAGLIYIPFGIACLVATFLWGKQLNLDYSRTAREQGIIIRPDQDENMDEFPLEKARIRSALYLVAVATGALLGYGWALQKGVHVAVPLVLQAIIGFAITGLFVALGTLLTDLNPDQSSTTATSANLVRCTLAATTLAVLQLMIERVGPGWCFTLFGMLSGVCGLLLLYELRNGHGWRRKRAANHKVSPSQT